MTDKSPSKADQVAALRLARASRSDRPKVSPELMAAFNVLLPKVKSSDVASLEPKVNRGRARDNLGRDLSNGLAKPVSRIAEQTPTSPTSEAEPKKKRAPRGTFDRNAYMREYMRKRRQKESKM
jgi:hypothetical protein